MTLREQLIRDEGRQLFPYRDTVGKLTIGVGRNLTDQGITPEEADILLDHDITMVSLVLRDEFDPWIEDLDEARRGVLLNMAFNVGLGGLLGFRRMLAAVQAGDYDGAAREMLDSLWARQVGARAVRLAEQMRTGEWK